MNNSLRKLQLTQLEILKVFDSICKQYNLKYSLYAGSLLGAVRHKGFIPWDDDLDVCMPRNDYNRFIEIWSNIQPEGYIIQNKENAPNFPQSFTKIRKEHSTFLQSEAEIGKYHTGIFLDIFPIDRIPDGKLNRLVFRWNCMQYQLLTREFAPHSGNFLIRICSSILLLLLPQNKRPKIRNRCLQKITKYNDSLDLCTICIETMASLRTVYSPRMLDSFTELQFEDQKFMCVSDWDEHLKRKFGDYMILPPEEDRTWKHHPIVIDFEHTYEEAMLGNER